MSDPKTVRCRHCDRPIFKGTRNGVRQWFHGDSHGGPEERWTACQETATVAEPQRRRRDDDA